MNLGLRIISISSKILNAVPNLQFSYKNLKINILIAKTANNLVDYFMVCS